MGAKKKNEEQLIETEIIIITEEQVDALPEKAVATVRSLKGSLPQAQLQIFIPVVQQYIELRELASTVKLEKDAEGNITKESIEVYKAAKKAVGAFNGELKRKMKDVKDPLNLILADVRKVDNTFKEESDNIKEAITTEFQPYEDEIARKKKEADDKKNAALKAEVDAANEAAEFERQKNLKSEVINKLKYGEIMEGITQKTVDAVADMNPRSLEQYLHAVRNTDFADIKGRYDVTVIDAETLESIEASFAKARAGAINLIDERLAKYAEDQKRAIEDGIRNAPAVPPVPPVPAQQIGKEISENIGQDHDLIKSRGIVDDSIATEITMKLYWNNTPEGFVKNVEALIVTLEKALQRRMRDGVTPALAELQTKFNQFNS